MILPPVPIPMPTPLVKAAAWVADAGHADLLAERMPSATEQDGADRFTDLLAALMAPPMVVPEATPLPEDGGPVAEGTLMTADAPDAVGAEPVDGLTIRLDGDGRPLAVPVVREPPPLAHQVKAVASPALATDRPVSDAPPVLAAESGSEAVARPPEAPSTPQADVPAVAQARRTPQAEGVEPAQPTAPAGLVGVVADLEAALPAVGERVAVQVVAGSTAGSAAPEVAPSASPRTPVAHAVDPQQTRPDHQGHPDTSSDSGQPQDGQVAAVADLPTADAEHVAMVSHLADEIVAQTVSAGGERILTPPVVTMPSAAPVRAAAAAEPTAPASASASTPRPATLPAVPSHQVTVVLDRGDGSDRIRVLVRGDTVHATILTTPGEHAALTSRTDVLRQALIDRGFSEARVLVRTAAGEQASLATSHVATALPEVAPSERLAAQAGRGSSDQGHGTHQPRGRTDDEAASRQRSRHHQPDEEHT